MGDQWEPPKAVVKLEGTITYRCASCGDRVDGATVVLSPVDENGELMPDTRAYHPEHVSQEVTHGS